MNKKLIVLCLAISLASAQFSWFSSISNAFNSFGNDVQSGFNSFGNQMQSGWNQFESQVTGGWNQFENQVTGGWDQFESQVTGGWDQFENQVTGGWNQFESQMENGWNQFESHVVSQANSVGNHIVSQAESVGNHVVSQANSIGNHIQSEWHKMSSAVQAGWNSAMKDVVAADSFLNHEIEEAAVSFADHVDTVASFVGHEITENAELIEHYLLVALECGESIANLLPMFATFAELIEGEQSIEGIVSHWNEYDSDIAELVANCGGDESQANMIREAKMDHSEQEIADCAAAVLDLAIAAARIATMEVDPDPSDVQDLISAIMGIAEHCVQGVEYAISDAENSHIGGGPMSSSHKKSTFSNMMADMSAASKLASLAG